MKQMHCIIIILRAVKVQVKEGAGWILRLTRRFVCQKMRLRDSLLIGTKLPALTANDGALSGSLLVPRMRVNEYRKYAVNNGYASSATQLYGNFITTVVK
jgi:hypothetical protein